MCGQYCAGWDPGVHPVHLLQREAAGNWFKLTLLGSDGRRMRTQNWALQYKAGWGWLLADDA